ncbi:MAG TPA: RNase adapter RapZ [Symbiobacteriaceae bacterium]|nr:RNase adapter RapZ [Symbiobacteriaceae bacterium]
MKQGMRLVIVTGMSGAGKTQAIKYLEDLSFFCVDNLPPALMPKMAELYVQTEGKLNRLALGIDIRGGHFFSNIVQALDELEKAGFTYQILFMDASDATLVSRYKESRRRHPLALQGRLMEGIRKERKLMQELRGRASKIIDTSKLKVAELRRELADFFTVESEGLGLHVNMVSFGFKHGSVPDADLVFDVRFLPNPHYVEDLKALTGETLAVQHYVMKWGVTQQFFKRLTSLIGFLLPQYLAEGKSHLTIAIGCTGGQHRSVCIAIKLADWIKERGFSVSVEHRDAPRELRDESAHDLREALPILEEEAPETLEEADLGLDFDDGDDVLDDDLVLEVGPDGDASGSTDEGSDREGDPDHGPKPGPVREEA